MTKRSDNLNGRQPDNVTHISDYLHLRIDDAGGRPSAWTAEKDGPWLAAEVRQADGETQTQHFVIQEVGKPKANYLIVAADDLYPNQCGSIYNALAIRITPELVQQLGLAVLDLHKSRLEEGMVRLPEGVAVQALALKSRPTHAHQWRIPMEDSLEEYLCDHKLAEDIPQDVYGCTFHLSPEGSIQLRCHHSLLDDLDGHEEPTLESATFDLTGIFPLVATDEDFV